MTPRKLIRNGVIQKLKIEEWTLETNKEELNRLFDLKVKEELDEIIRSERRDVYEFADLLQVAHDYAALNGFSDDDLYKAIDQKLTDKGAFTNAVLISLNPNNSSSKLYTKDQ